MPCLSINFNASVGPLISLAVFPFNISQAGITGTPSAPINLSQYMALIDTGASCTCISSKVIGDLKLTPMGKQSVGGVHGSKPTNLYQFTIGLLFPSSQLPTGVVTANVAPFPVTGAEFFPQPGFDVLLGRDILCHGTFSMSFDGHATMCV